MQTTLYPTGLQTHMSFRIRQVAYVSEVQWMRGSVDGWEGASNQGRGLQQTGDDGIAPSSTLEN